MPLLIAPDELADLRARDPRVRVLDVRWRLDRPDGRPEYLDAHLPGAVYVDFDRELSRHGTPAEGRHPLPGRLVLQDAARRWGVDDGDTVVLYDDVQSMAAARAWWLLTRTGIGDVRVLDGGLAAWAAAGLPLEAGEVSPASGNVTLAPLTGAIADMDAAAAWPRRGVLIDARAAERYRGEVEPFDPVAGHVPGAVNLPMAALVRDDGRLREPAELRAAFASAGVGEGVPVAAYCGSGVTAAHTALAGAVAGIEVAVFPGSWSAWSNTPGRPVATGASPFGAGRG